VSWGCFACMPHTCFAKKSPSDHFAAPGWGGVLRKLERKHVPWPLPLGDLVGWGGGQGQALAWAQRLVGGGVSPSPTLSLKEPSASSSSPLGGLIGCVLWQNFIRPHLWLRRLVCAVLLQGLLPSAAPPPSSMFSKLFKSSYEPIADEVESAPRVPTGEQPK
jgi:hypothetical protein